MMDQVEAAGAQFVVTPGASREVLEAGVQCAVPVLPGIATATEIMEGYALGYRRFELFPAEVCGGIAALKAFGGPFADVRFCPTGGVNAGNAAQYLALANVVQVYGGTWMIDPASLRQWRLGAYPASHRRCARRSG
ncbi:2-dehydro-3-deoxy-phosphogluconate aldolase OS=Stutzerimonas stutzeri OX=316 GN=CXK95_18420 PE=3 SV=1 [Stutzerimonas stutzeri]